MKAIIAKARDDPLISNSFYLVLASGISAALGFVFWIIIARIYPPEAVGQGALLLSAMAIINTLTLMGFDVGIIRFWDILVLR